MSRENVEIVRQVIESNRSDDLEARIEAALALFDPSGEYTPARAAFDSQTYRGHSGIRRYFSDLADSWAEWRSEVEDVVEVGPDTVVATFRFHATGKNSGVPIEARLGAVVVLSHGKVLRGQAYSSPEEALEAVGLRE
ncbi:MAG: hypothetical protein QOI98_2514 [Solirubrobacteraceae bacterium]|jgi:ketosteroid isomerase-like protein|nr:hypothetical protein [Solirubrobacteraceae bacterium]